jgi:hypothetical protein
LPGFADPVSEILSTALGAKQSSRYAPNIASSGYCFAGGCCDINGCGNHGETAMLSEKFDAYGEALPQAEREAAKSGSALLSRIGQAVFWLLVIAIVSARIIYYPASPAFEVGTATDAKQTLAR